MEIARRVYTGLAYLFLLAVVIEVFLAGSGIFGDFDKDLDPHRAFGNLLVIVGVVLLVLALSGRLGSLLIGLTFALVVLVVLQSVWVHFDSRWMKAIHPTMALVIFVLAHYLAQRSRKVRSEPGDGPS